MDVYCLYLRPTLPDTLEVGLAMSCQKRWGGLHATLCSFAPKVGKERGHGSSLLRTMDAMHAAACPPALSTLGSEHVGVFRWKLDPDASIRAKTLKNGLVVLHLPETSHTLQAISRVAKGMKLANAREADELHITLGQNKYFDLDMIQALQQILRNCVSWRLVIVKCFANEEKLCVSEDREETLLEWASHEQVQLALDTLTAEYADRIEGTCNVTVTFLDGAEICIEVAPSVTGANLKTIIERQFDMSKFRFVEKLIFDETLLADTQTLDDFGIAPHSLATCQAILGKMDPDAFVTSHKVQLLEQFTQYARRSSRPGGARISCSSLAVILLQFLKDLYARGEEAEKDIEAFLQGPGLGRLESYYNVDREGFHQQQFLDLIKIEYCIWMAFCEIAGGEGKTLSFLQFKAEQTFLSDLFPRAADIDELTFNGFSTSGTWRLIDFRHAMHPGL